MRKLVIDRFEGNYVICEDENKKLFAIDKKELPEDTKEGDVLNISEDKIEIDEQETINRRNKIKQLQKELFK